ncbi:hypothetical protein Tco_0834273 [Tanacetum coccineum]
MMVLVVGMKYEDMRTNYRCIAHTPIIQFLDIHERKSDAQIRVNVEKVAALVNFNTEAVLRGVWDYLKLSICFLDRSVMVISATLYGPDSDSITASPFAYIVVVSMDWNVMPRAPIQVKPFEGYRRTVGPNGIEIHGIVSNSSPSPRRKTQDNLELVNKKQPQGHDEL